MDKTERFLRDFVEQFNRGVETGDFRAWIKLFAPDATMTFFGAPRGPFNGRDAIAAGYRRNPPDDEIEIIDSHVREGTVIAGYSWLRAPYVRAGEMRMVLTDNLVQTVEIFV
jgi:hypothetical protein